MESPRRLPASNSGGSPWRTAQESLRDWRLDRLLRDQLPGLRPVVLARARQRLRTYGLTLDEGDLESCYLAAWASVHARLARGGQVENVGGLLVVLTFRRAIDVHRRRPPGIELTLDLTEPADPTEPADVAAGNRETIRWLREAIDFELSGRERQALAACWWRGLTRTEAASILGIPEKRMQKLMDDATAKMRGALRAIAEGRWCEHRASLIKGYALGLLDPTGERHRQAREHLEHCAACRSRVRTLGLQASSGGAGLDVFGPART